VTLAKQIFINAIKLVEIDGQTILPTAVSYAGRKAVIGKDALIADNTSNVVHDNFKLALGGIDPRTREREQVSIGGAEWRSAVGLTKDFVDTSLDKVRDWIGRENLKPASRILVAEPISLAASPDVSNDWLKNYRHHLKRILEAREQFRDVAFLPEPFAVFQYYRYGIKHPLIANERKHVALVIDFGGGTFDVSVIETTAKGDISLSGKNSRPLSAASIPIGGAFINQQIARSLLFSNLAKGTDKQRVEHAIKKYEDFIHGRLINPSDLQDDLSQFFAHFRRFLTEIEKAKISLCQRITDWRLDSDFPLDLAITIKVPTTPLRREPGLTDARLSAFDFRQLFERSIWKAKLQPTVLNAVKRGREGLTEQPISVALLSGGSANIRWLRELLQRDLASELPDVTVLELQENFQEIVAKGLAIECARRSYQDSEGDFGAVTYNPLHLYTAANEGTRESPRYRPVTEGLPTPDAEGIVLPSASVMARYLDKPMCWKFRLRHAPSNSLDYFFTRGPWGDDDQYLAQNIEHRVQTPRGIGFGASLWVEITVREDGTTTPRFIYQREGPGKPERYVDARPFVLDMTSAGSSGVSEAYIGFDFGSTSSSFSFVAKSDLSTFDARGQDKSWLQLNDLLASLPYLVAHPIRKYIAETRTELLESRGLEAVEAALTYAAYISYSELRAIGDRKATHLFKAFQHRSAGPLWRLFQDAQERLGNRAHFSKELKALLQNGNRELVEKTVDQLANFKHNKKSEIDYKRVLTVLGNSIARSLSGRFFGGFEDVRKRGFGGGFSGHFRVATGDNQPFVHILEYKGKESFAQEELYLLDNTNGNGLALTPLMLWHRRASSTDPDGVDLYVFDCTESKQAEPQYVYKATSSKDTLSASKSTDLRELAVELESLRREDLSRSLVEGLTLSHRDMD